MIAKLMIDSDANAAYLRLHDGVVDRTCEVAPGVMVDLDSMNVVLGIEVLTLDTQIPYTELVQKYHVRSDEVRVLDLIRPNVTYFISRQTSAAPSRSEDHTQVPA